MNPVRPSIRNTFILIFAVLFVGSFAVLFAMQQLGLQKPPTNTNTGVPITPGTLPGTGTGTKLAKFSSLEALREFLTAHAGSEVATGKALPMMERGSAAVGAPSDMMGTSPAPQGFGGGADYSQTNIQVAGVDESDIVKTDGKYIYSVSGNSVYIVSAYPPDNASVLAKIEFKSTPQNVYLNGNRLVVFGYDQVIYNRAAGLRIRPGSQYTFFKIFDVSDPKNPKQLRDLDFEGSYLNSRMIGDYVYLLTTKYSYNIFDDPYPLPRILENGDKLYNDPSAPGYVFPNVYYFDADYNGVNLTNVHAINVAKTDAAISTESYAMDYGQQIYMSQSALYITYTKYVSEDQLVYEASKGILLPRLSASDQKRVAEIEAVPAYILSSAEKFAKIQQIIERSMAGLSDEEVKQLQDQIMKIVKDKMPEIQKQLERTVIHKIAVSQGSLSYQGAGDVPGYVLNQYAMDEDGGYFRIATTKRRSWSQIDDQDSSTDSYSNLYVLDGAMRTVGSIENLEPGEQIYSVRFMQHRAYLVTFKQTDPLFVVDLSDPRNPKVLGQLKVPGFSNYLHPYDETMLIGLGKNAVENEFGGATIKGLKISLYDVSDVANPKEIAQYAINDPSSDSPALYEPKAFLFSKEKNLLVIPVTLQGRGGGVPVPLMEPMMEKQGVSSDSATTIFPILPPRYDYFADAYVFSITKNSISLKGKIEHDFQQQTNDYRDASVKRSLYISDILYTISDAAIKANALSDLTEKAVLDLVKYPSGDDFTVVN